MILQRSVGRRENFKEVKSFYDEHGDGGWIK